MSDSENDSTPELPPELSALEEGDPEAIGPYAVVGRLGAGGMGAVYGALDDTGRCVAVKVIHQRYAQQAEFRERFAREARLMELLDAECAPAFLGADAEAEEPWLATEFVPGRTLTAHVRESGPLSGGALLALAAGAVEALAAVHGAGMLHRDIKPGNIMLSPAGPRLVDFGIARMLDEDDDTEHIYGTPGYLPPERLDGGPSSTAGDIFAWGALVAYAATGRHAYGMDGAAQVLQRVRAGEHNLTGLPDLLRPLVEQVLAPDPAQRPTALDCYIQVLALAEPAQPVQDTEQARRTSLRRILAAAWHGFDAAGHDPRTWAALAGITGAGLTAITALWAQQEAARRGDTTETAQGPDKTTEAPDKTAETAEAASGSTEASSPGQFAPNNPGTGPSAEPAPEGGAISQPTTDPAPAPEPTGAPGEFADSTHTIAETTAEVATEVAGEAAAQGAVTASTSGGATTAGTSALTSGTAVKTGGAIAGTLGAVAVTAVLLWPHSPPSLMEHDGPVLSAEFSPDGATLLTASLDDTVRLWDADTGEELASFHHEDEEGASDPQGNELGVDRNLLWAHFTPNGTNFVSLDLNIHLWDVTSKEPITIFSPDQFLEPPEAGDIYYRFRFRGRSSTVDPSGTIVVIGYLNHISSDLENFDVDAKIAMWDIENGEEISNFDLPEFESFFVLDISPDGSTLAAGSDESHRVWLLDAETGERITTFTGHDDTVSSVRFSPDGSTLATASADGTVRMWDVDTGEETNTITEYDDEMGVSSMAAFSPDGTILATAKNSADDREEDELGDSIIQLWDVETGEEIITVTTYDAAMHSLAFSPDGDTLATASEDGTVRLWDVDTGEELTTDE